MKYIGRKVNVGVGVEAIRGTAVAVQNWTPKTDFSFEEQMELTLDNSSVGTIVDARDSFVSKNFGEGEIGGNIQVNSLGFYLLGVFGEVNTVVDSVGAYEHTFSLDESNQGQTLTVGLDDPVIGDMSYPLSSIASFNINAEVGEYVTFTANIKSKKGTATTHTVTYTDDNKLRALDSVFKVAENLAGLDGADAICLRSFSLTFERNLEDDYCLDGTEPKDYINQSFSVSGSFTAVFQALTLRAYALAGTKRAIRFEVKDTTTTIGESSNPTLKIELPIVTFEEFSRTQGNDETVTQTLGFKGLYSSVDESVCDVYLVNTREDYDPAS